MSPFSTSDKSKIKIMNLANYDNNKKNHEGGMVKDLVQFQHVFNFERRLN